MPKSRKQMRGGFYTNTSSPTTNTSNSIMGFFNDAWKKTKETSQNMLSSMNKPTTTTPAPVQNTYPNTITGGKRTRRKRGGYYTTRPFTGAPVDHIKMARPTYWIKGGKKRTKKRRNLKTRSRSKK